MNRLTFPMTTSGIDGQFGYPLNYPMMDYGHRSSDDERPWPLTQDRLFTPRVKKVFVFIAVTSFLIGFAWSKLR